MRLVNAVRELRVERGEDIRTIALHTRGRAHGDVRAGGRRGGAASTARTSTSARWSGRWSRRAPTRRGSGGASSPSDPSSPSCATAWGSRSSARARDVMRRLGDKIGAKLLAEQADVPVAAWSGGPVDTLDDGPDATPQTIGYPLMIKATAGGGGRGIRRVDDDAGLAEAFESARSGGAQGVRRRDRVHGARRDGRPPRRGPGDRRPPRHGVGRRRARLQHAAAQPEGDRGVAVHRADAGAGPRPAGGGGAPGRARRLPQRRHGRVPVPAGRAALRVPRGQHAPAGRAPGHRADDRARPREAAAARRRRRPAGGRAAADRGLRRSRPASTPRIRSGLRPGAGHDRGADAARRARASGSTPASPRATSSRRSTTR